MNRIIAHIDMDAFFAAVEQLDNPDYRGKPVIVGADPKGGRGRGVVSASSYEARVFGVKSAMPISLAYKKCPHGIFVEPRGRRYSEISENIMEILARFSPLVEQISVDEAFIDLTGTEKLFGPPEITAVEIKDRIFRETGLTASVGIASNKSIAKIASDINKPDGITICAPGNEKKFLAPLPIEKIWGVGVKTSARLKQMGFITIGDIQNGDKKKFELEFGAAGLHIYLLANGIDDRAVVPAEGIKSISEERTYENDIDDADEIEKTILFLSDRVAYRARQQSACGRTVTLKIRLTGFETFTRSRTLETAVNDTFSIRDCAATLFRSFDRRDKTVRLIGVKISNLDFAGGCEGAQLELFSAADESSSERIRHEKIESLLDKIKAAHGKKISRASLMPAHPAEEKND